MLGVLPDSTPDGVDEGLGLAQASAEKGLESFPGNGDVSLVLDLALVLLPAEQGGILQEGGRKRNSVRSRGTGGGEVVFALLEEIVAFHMGLTPIHV